MVQLAKEMGLLAPRKDTRFFIVPGARHSEASSFDEIDWFAAIIDWVKKDISPTQLVYDRLSGKASRGEMLVCEYPTWPKYDGLGDGKAASKFTCVTR
jgi:feruloyl esterase